MPIEQWAARPIITVDGSRLADTLERRLRRVEVDTDVIGPGGCRVVLDDPDRSALAGGPFDFNKPLTIAATDGQQHAVVFDGLVVSIGFDFDEQGACATVTGFDHAFGLFNGVHTTSYQNVSDSDIANQIAGELGLDTSEIDSSPVVHDHIGQLNETHWEFLNRRAAEIDYEVRIDGKKLRFRKAAEADDAPEPGDHASTEPLQLTPGAELVRFSARITSIGIVQNVEVRGWDVANKQAITSTSSVQTRSTSMSDDPPSIAGHDGSTTVLAPATPLGTQAECDARAAAEAERIAGASLHAEGVAVGTPSLRAGVSVSVGKAGGRLDGRFTVTRARHVWSGSNYRTHFVASGTHDRSLLGLTTGGSRGDTGRMSAGPVVGIVTNASDPQSMGRVKLKFPWLSNDFESDWARVTAPGAGNKRGLLLTPEVDDEVLVAFEHGDMRRPLVLGGLFNGVDKTAHDDGGVDTNSGKVITRGLRSRNGHSMLIAEADGSESVSIASSDGKLAIVLDVTNGLVKIQSGGDVKVSAEGNFEVDCKDFTVNASGGANVSANQGISIKATAQVIVQGQQILLN